MASRTPSKLRDVDQLRGYAALAVALYHFLLAYVPAASAPKAMTALGLVAQRPFLIAPLNGHFMVTVFFVLSSFVLTRGLVAAGSDRTRGVIAIAKRFPRLLPLTLIGVLMAAVLYLLGWLPTREVAAITHSGWLDRSGGIKYWEPWPAVSLPGAARDGLLLFVHGVSQFNSALWTMKYELFGSIFALLGATLIGSKQRPIADALLLTLLAFLALRIHPLCAICVATVYVAKYVLVRPADLKLPLALGLIGVGLILGSTFKALPEELAWDEWTRTQVMRIDWLVHGAGATALLVGMRGIARVRDADGWIGHQLGRLSFAVYVIHIPVQSAVAGAIILTFGYHPIGVVGALLLSTAAIFLLAWPLSRLDERWMAQLNRWFGKRPAPMSGQQAASSNPAP
ncbi:acyltransferase family protein, partial [Sphingomonas sp. SRS2]|uniref:acyltransferase family protein n=1 Tax=Sphingomonas sp. SRS2 TaxID=133190 RepID=UPI0006184A1C